MFVGHLNDSAKLAGVGFGNMCVNLTAMCVVVGLNGAQETFVSQSYGAGNKYMCGVYLNRGRYVVVLAFIPISIILYNAESLFLMIG